jgi:hypothetical protein
MIILVCGTIYYFPAAIVKISALLSKNPCTNSFVASVLKYRPKKTIKITNQKISCLIILLYSIII